jgi:hypothetical protein
MAQPIFNQGTGGVADSPLPIQTARSGNYTVAAADIANGYSSPIELLWPVGFADTNYTVNVSVEKIFGINAPKALVHMAQFERMQDVQTGRSQGIIVVLSTGGGGENWKAGDTFVIHAIAIHD